MKLSTTRVLRVLGAVPIVTIGVMVVAAILAGCAAPPESPPEPDVFEYTDDLGAVRRCDASTPEPCELVSPATRRAVAPGKRIEA